MSEQPIQKRIVIEFYYDENRIYDWDADMQAEYKTKAAFMQWLCEHEGIMGVLNMLPGNYRVLAVEDIEAKDD